MLIDNGLLLLTISCGLRHVMYNGTLVELLSCDMFKFLLAIPKGSQPISDFVCVSIACEICLCVTGFPEDHLTRKLLMTVKRSELNLFIDQSEMRIFVVDHNIALSGYERCTLALYTCKLVKIRTGLPIRQDFTERI